MADGMAAFTRHWGAQQAAKDKASDADRQLRLLKGLGEAKARVDQGTIEDAQFPDLYDQLAAQSEPQNYFFEPYASQWCPQIVRKGNLIPLPSVIATSLEEELQSLTLSGLLPAIDHAWTSVDHRLFLWSYKQRGRFVLFEMDQPVVAVGLCVVPKTGVFTDKVKHLLVVATTVEVVLVAVLYEDNRTLASGLRLQRTKLSVSTDSTVVRRIATTAAHGRIFFGGADGGVYELLYGSGSSSKASDGLDASLFIPAFLQRSGCRKIAHTSQLANYLPSFLSALAGSAAKLLEFAVDDDRHVLYALHEQGDVDVFDLGASGNDMKLVCTVNLIQDGAKYARENRRTRVSCPDERLFQGGSSQLKIVSLAVVGRTESALVTLVALASNGLRFYLTVHSRRTYTAGSSIPPSKRPTRLEILYIRLPPPAVTLADAPPYHAKEGMQPGFAPGKSPSSVHFGFYRQGVALLVDGAKDQQDRVVGLAHDPINHSPVLPAAVARKQTIRESVALESSIGKIVDVQELDDTALEQSRQIRQLAVLSAGRSGSAGAKRSYDEMANGFNSSSSVLGADAVPIVGEVALQYSCPSRHFLCLSNAGIQVFKKIRPIDQLHRALLLSRGHDLKATLAAFVRSFGEVQLCCMLLALACGVQSDPLTVDGSSAAAAAASVVHRAGVKSDEYIFTTAMQGIFECGQLPRSSTADASSSAAASSSSTRIVLTTDFGMSFQHDGLVLFLTRVLRPLWFPKSIGRRVSSAATPVYECVHTKASLDEVREVLFQLRQLMETAGPYAVSIGSGAVLVENAIDEFGDAVRNDDATRTAELASRYHKQRNEEQRKQEMRFKAEQRSLFLLYQLVLRSVEAISLLRLAMDFQVPLDETLARLSFGDLVTTAEGTSAAKLMTKALMKGRDENNQFLVQQLREQCPSFFTVGDLWHYQGYKSLALAKLSAPGGPRRAHLAESLRQFVNACHMWDTQDCVVVLQGICDDYALLDFYEGVVKLSLACAQTFHDAAATDLSGAKLTWKRQCFGCILLALQRLLESNGASPQAVDEMVRLDAADRRSFVEEVLHLALVSDDSDFHALLYAWLYEHGHTSLLTSVRSPFIEDFLKHRDQDLLIKMYMEQRKYLVAAKVWWARAHEDDNTDVVKRQYFVSKALGCLTSVEDVSEAADAIREVRDVLDVLQLQVRVLKALEQATVEVEATTQGNNSVAVEAELQQRKQDLALLSFKIFDATTLYNQFASKYDMWSECLHIIHACRSEEADVVELLWRKILFDMVPPAASSPEFNAWRLDQCEQAGLPQQQQQQQSTSIAMSFESGYWIGQMQMKVLRLGKALYADAGSSGADASALSTFVVPVGFLAKQLEHLASWHQRLTHTTTTSSDAFHWILKLFLDIGVPHRVLLSYYERLYREQGGDEWTLHLLQAVLALLVLWKRHASSPRAANDQLAEYAACCPHIVALCDDVVTDLKAFSSDGRATVQALLDHFRRYKSDLMHLRNPL